MRHKVFEVKLKNGAEGLFIHVPNATVMTFEYNFRAGEFLVEKKKWETPHIMEHMLLGANELVPRARDFQAEFEKNGAYSNASTGTYDITYDAECADFEWDRIADLLQVAVSRPLFLQDEFEAEFGNVREELIGRSNNHFRNLSLALRQAYGLLALTDPQRIEMMQNVDLADILNHYRKTHTSSNLRFVIAGKLPQYRRNKLQNIIEGIQLRPGTGRIELPDEKPRTLKRPLYIENDTVKNLYFYIDTFLMKRLENPEMDALQILNIIMTETLYSRILGTARERGLVYGMNSGFGQTKLISNWWVGAQVSIKNAPKLFDIVVNELKGVFDTKLAETDINAAKQYAIGRYQRGAQTVGGIAAGYSGRYFFDGVVDDYYKYPERIESVTKEAIVDITKEMFSEDIWGLGVLGSCGEDFLVELNDKISPLWRKS